MAVWQERFITPNPYTRPQEKLNAVKKAVIHWTANPGATAAGHYGYFNTERSTYASAHIFVDKTEAINIIPLSEVAYHANDVQRRNADGSAWRGVQELLPNANFLSVSVEMCVESDGTIHPNTIAKTEDVFVELCKMFHLNPLTDIVRHHDITYKNCPAPWVSNGQSFIDFKNRVNVKMNGSAPAPTNEVIYRIRKDWADATSQIGAFASLDSAKALADQHKAEGYKVFDSTGKIVYDPTPAPAPQPTHMYRVRLNWADASSQIGAFSSLDGAKAIADQNKDKGYKVFDENGNVVYDPTPAPVVTTHMYRVRKSWNDVTSQIGAFSDLSNAKDLADKNPGYVVFDENGNAVYAPVAQTTPAPVQPAPTPAPEPAPTPVAQEPVQQPVQDAQPAVQEPVAPQPAPVVDPTPTPVVDPHAGHHDIMGKSEIEADKMIAFIKEVNPDAQNIEEIAKSFLAVGDKYGIKGDVAFCQSIIETGYFKFDGGTAVTPDQHNYAGIGVTSKGIKGNAFATVVNGVTAQLQHLFAYASKDAVPSGETILDPRFQYVTRGIAPHWEDLDNRWAMNSHYGEDIIALHDKLANYVIPVQPEPVTQEPVQPVQPVESQPVTEAPVNEVPVNDTPQPEVPVQNVQQPEPTTDAPVQENPVPTVEPTPATEAPVENNQPTPVVEQPAQPEPAQEPTPTPVDETPAPVENVQPAPVVENPVSEQPQQETPQQPEEQPVVEEPTPEPIQTTPVPVQPEPAKENKQTKQYKSLIDYFFQKLKEFFGKK